MVSNDEKAMAIFAFFIEEDPKMKHPNEFFVKLVGAKQANTAKMMYHARLPIDDIDAKCYKK